MTSSPAVFYHESLSQFRLSHVLHPELEEIGTSFKSQNIKWKKEREKKDERTQFLFLFEWSVPSFIFILMFPVVDGDIASEAGIVSSSSDFQAKRFIMITLHERESHPSALSFFLRTVRRPISDPHNKGIPWPSRSLSKRKVIDGLFSRGDAPGNPD